MYPFVTKSEICLTWRINPGTCKWLITMVSWCPLRIGFFPFQMVLSMAYKSKLLTTYQSWDDPPVVTTATLRNVILQPQWQVGTPRKGCGKPWGCCLPKHVLLGAGLQPSWIFKIGQIKSCPQVDKYNGTITYSYFLFTTIGWLVKVCWALLLRTISLG